MQPVTNNLAKALEEIDRLAEVAHDPELHDATLEGQVTFCPGCAIKHAVRIVRKEITKEL